MVMGWSRKTHFKCVQIYHVEEGVLMFLSFWGQHYEQSCKWLSKGGSGGKADTQMVAWWNPGTHSDSAPFKPCSNQSTLQTLFPHLCNDYDTLCPPYLSVSSENGIYLLSTYFVSGTIIGIKDPGLNKEDKICVFIGLRVCSWW